MSEPCTWIEIRRPSRTSLSTCEAITFSPEMAHTSPNCSPMRNSSAVSSPLAKENDTHLLTFDKCPN